MEKTEANKAFKSAEKDLKEKEITKFKEVVKCTLEKLELKKKERHILDKEIQILKKDIDDLKAGRLDKIAERQDKDKEAEAISIIKVTEIIRELPYPDCPVYPYTPWNRPWEISYGNSYYSNGNTVMDSIVFCSTEAKYNTTGSYMLSNGTVKNI